MPHAPAAPGPPARTVELIFLSLAVTLAVATALRLPAAWESGNALNHVSGSWLALSDDLAHGTLYRPIRDAALGYGGTRYLPLVFALHAALLRAGVGLLAAGWALSAAAGVLLVAGGFLVLRGLGLRRVPALGFALLALAGFASQHALAAMRGDLLPVALSALGLAAAARLRGPARIAAAAVLLALAFAGKPTAITATAAAALWLALRGERRASALLVLLTGALDAGVLLATDALSGGRFLAILRACAVDVTAGGLARSPLRLAAELVREDGAGLVVALSGTVAVLAASPAIVRAVRARRPLPPIVLPALWLAVAGGAALVVFASAGAGMNHLVELEAAAALALGAGSLGPAPRSARALAPLAAAAGLAVVVSTWRDDVRTARLEDLRAVVRALPAGPVLSEDPTVPLLAGARPVVLDPWMLRVAASKDAALEDELAANLAGGRYPAVVLFQDLDAPGAEAWYADRNLGLPLVSAIRQGYRHAAAIGRYHLYLPHPPPPPDGGEPRLTTASQARSVVTGPEAR